jgi:hypothetical protein
MEVEGLGDPAFDFSSSQGYTIFTWPIQRLGGQRSAVASLRTAKVQANISLHSQDVESDRSLICSR